MKTLLMTVLFMVSGSVFALDECFTGSWFDPDRVGEGINVEVNKDGALTVAYFYTFDKRGRQIWYSMIGEETLVMESTVVVDDVDFITKTVDVGTAAVEPITNDVMVFGYVRLIEWNPIRKEFTLCDKEADDTCEAIHVYRRLTQPIACTK